MTLSIIFTLNQSTLLFLPPREPESIGKVVQVFIQPVKEATVNTLTTFFLAQREISDMILHLVTCPSLPIPRSLELDTPTYKLTAGTKKWQIAQDLKLKWGEDAVSPASYKWVFTFEPKTRFESDENNVKGNVKGAVRVSI